MKTLRFFLFFMVFGLLAISCGDDDPDDGNVDCNNANSVNAELMDEINAWTAAASAWANDPTDPGLCNDYKDATLDYLNALRALEDCANDAGVGVEFANSITQAEEALAQLTC